MFLSTDGLKRCPNCHLVPCITFDAPGVWINCEKHGHKALGADIPQAVKHWNHYISFIVGDMGRSYAQKISTHIL